MSKSRKRQAVHPSRLLCHLCRLNGGGRMGEGGVFGDGKVARPKTWVESGMAGPSWTCMHARQDPTFISRNRTSFRSCHHDLLSTCPQDAFAGEHWMSKSRFNLPHDGSLKMSPSKNFVLAIALTSVGCQGHVLEKHNTSKQQPHILLSESGTLQAAATFSGDILASSHTHIPQDATF